MNNYSQYTTWQEVDGKLSPVCERPDSKTYINECRYHSWQTDNNIYNESLKISLPIIGDIESIKGRKDLRPDIHFRFDNISFMDDGTQCDNNSDLAVSFKTVAVLIDNKQKQTIEKFQELATHKIDFTDTKQLAEDCWLFLTNDKLPEKATIKKEAFLHEVKIMIDAAVGMNLLLKEKSQPKELPKQLEEDKKPLSENYQWDERQKYWEDITAYNNQAKDVMPAIFCPTCNPTTWKEQPIPKSVKGKMECEHCGKEIIKNIENIVVPNLNECLVCHHYNCICSIKKVMYEK